MLVENDFWCALWVGNVLNIHNEANAHASRTKGTQKSFQKALNKKKDEKSEKIDFL